MSFPIAPPIEPMLSALQEEMPLGDGWLYEPKWDGFRAVIFRDGAELFTQSRKQLPLDRYFPDLAEPFRAALPERCVIDGEIIMPTPRGLDFELLQLRLHPAASRVAKLASENPCAFVAFDLLALGDRDLRSTPLAERRALLVEHVKQSPRVVLTPQTKDPVEARTWFERFEGAGLDGVIAKKNDLLYLPGERVMVKLKHQRTVDCVVGGYREHQNGGVGSLLLGLYDENKVFHFVGHTSSFSAKERVKLLEELKPLAGKMSFGEGRTPGGPSRWNQARDLEWTPLEPVLVCEVSFDYLQGDRFRHASRFLRWRKDKAPEQCNFDQLQRPDAFALSQIVPLQS